MRFSIFGQCALGVLSTALLCGSAAAQLCPGDDVLEPNGSCLNPAPLALGLTSPLNIKDAGDEDFFYRTVAHNEELMIDCWFDHLVGDIDLELYGVSGPCNLALAFSSTLVGFDYEQIIYANTSGVPQDVMLRVFRPIPGQLCTTYSLLVTSIISPCVSTPDDVYWPNYSCYSAVALSPGTYSGLQVFNLPREDFFKIDVPNGGTLNMDTVFNHAGGDINTYIYESWTVGQLLCGNSLYAVASGTSATDNEFLSVTNTSGSTMTYYLQVSITPPVAYTCNAYDLILTVYSGPPGTALCFGDGFSAGPCPCGNQSNFGAGEGCRNSLGSGSTLNAAGTTSVSTDDISFTVSQGRPNQPGMLLQGASLQQVWFKDGILCTGNPTERVEVVFLDAFGVATTSSSIVTNGNVSAGNTRWYQMWSRDPGGVSPCGTGSNFSHALAITYTP